MATTRRATEFMLSLENSARNQNSQAEMKVVGYIRESTREQGISGYRPGVQKANIENYCQRHNFKIAEMFSDWGSGGSVKDRPAFQRMLEFAKSEKVKFIVIDETSRFFRDVHETLGFEEDLEKNHGIFAVDTRIDFNPRQYLEGRMSPAIWSQRMYARVRAEEERRVIQQRVGEGYAKKADKGQYVGRLCFALEWMDENKKYVRFNKAKGKVVRELFRLYASGNYGFTTLARHMNEEGYTQDKVKRVEIQKGGAPYLECQSYVEKFTSHLVRSILRNKTYIGRQSTGANLKLKSLDEENQEINLAPLIEEELFNRTQALVRKNRRGYSAAKGKTNSRQKRVYLLQGLIHSAENGSAMYGHAEVHNKTGTVVRRYMAKDNKRGVGKKIPSLRADEVEIQIAELLKLIKIRNINDIEADLRTIIKIKASEIKKAKASKTFDRKKQNQLKSLEEILEDRDDWNIRKLVEDLKHELAEEKPNAKISEQLSKYYSLLELRSILKDLSGGFEEMRSLLARKELINILFKKIFVANIKKENVESPLHWVGKSRTAQRYEKEAEQLAIFLKRFTAHFFESVWAKRKSGNESKDLVLFKPTGLFLLMVDQELERPSKSSNSAGNSPAVSGGEPYRNSLNTFPIHQIYFKSVASPNEKKR